MLSKLTKNDNFQRFLIETLQTYEFLSHKTIIHVRAAVQSSIYILYRR